MKQGWWSGSSGRAPEFKPQPPHPRKEEETSESSSYTPCAPRGKEQPCEGTVSQEERPHQTLSDGTLTLDFQPLELREKISVA
jgi:hypothetical protein